MWRRVAAKASCRPRPSGFHDGRSAPQRIRHLPARDATRTGGVRLAARARSRCSRSTTARTSAEGAPSGGPAAGDVRGDGRVQAGGHPRARAARDGSCSTRRWGRPMSSPTARCPAERASGRDRGRPAIRGRRRPRQPGAARLVGRAGEAAGRLRRQVARLLPPRGRERRMPRSGSCRGGRRLPRGRPAVVRRAAGLRSASGRQADGRSARRGVIETARRLTALGGDILKAEFPYDPASTIRPRGPTHVRSSTSPVACHGCSCRGGVDDAKFERQV